MLKGSARECAKKGAWLWAKVRVLQRRSRATEAREQMRAQLEAKLARKLRVFWAKLQFEFEFEFVQSSCELQVSCNSPKTRRLACKTSARARRVARERK